MNIDANLLFVIFFGWTLALLQYVIPLIVGIGSPERALAKNRDPTLRKKVAILIPCFNEGAQAYQTVKSICDSEYPKSLLEIIVIDDHSTDDSFEWIQKAVVDFSPKFKLRAVRQPVNSGKQDALIRGANLAPDADIFIFIDSDGILEKGAVAELVSSFTSEHVGGVGGQVRVTNVNENLLTQAQTIQYFYSFHLMRLFENYLGSSVCISGCLFAMRRDAFFLIAPEVAKCNFLGVKFTAADDRYMTHLLNLNGYGTYMNLDAYCWTSAPSQFKKYFLQQWRWKRAGIYDFLLTVTTLPRHIKSMNMLSILNLLLPETVEIVMIFSLFYAVTQHLVLRWALYFMIISLFILVPFLLLVKHQMKKRAPDQVTKSSVLLLTPLMAAWGLTGMSLLQFLAFFTMDSSSWGTRVLTPKKEEK